MERRTNPKIEARIAAVSRRIAELREGAGLTQAELAEKLGMTTPNYQRIEHDLHVPTLRMLLRVAAALDVDVVELFVPPKAKKRRPPGRPAKS